LTAARAPRPTLLIYNALDDCCFRAPLVKPDIYDRIRPFFRLMNHPTALGWHENTDPGTHNYQLDNRQQAYRFFGKHFRWPISTDGIHIGSEIRDREALAAGIPEDNLTIAGLARVLATTNRRSLKQSDSSARRRLVSVTRYAPVSVERAWSIANTSSAGVNTQSYRLGMSNGLSAVGVWLQNKNALESAAVTVLLDDFGRKATVGVAADRLNRGEQVFAADLLLSGDFAPSKPADYALLLSSTGDRSIGLRAAQLIALAQWVKKSPASRVRMQARGMRSQTAALIAGAMEPGSFAEIVIDEGIDSLARLLNTPVKYRSAPELFCLDLYKEFDVDSLARLAGRGRVRQTFSTKSTRQP
jgi:hypothetical protein